jgi:hypothetical protein
MIWDYKNHTIELKAGKFQFNTSDGVQHVCASLDEAMEMIDELTAEYYNMTREQYKQLLSKLTDREKDFVDSMLWELYDHVDNAYCDRGVNMDFKLPEIGLD